MISLAAFKPHIMPFAPTAPEPMVILYLRQAAREFCKETRCWREVITTPITANPVEPIIPAGATIVAVQSAKINGRDLSPMLFEEADIDTYLTQEGRAVGFTQDEIGRFIIMPFEAGDLVMSCFLAPSAGPQRTTLNPATEAQNQVPDFLYTEHAEAIGYGALSRLLALPAQEWTNGDLAGYFAAKFQEAKGGGQVDAAKGKQRAPIRTRARFM